MSTNCSNTIASPAFKGQSVWVTLSGAEALSIMPILELGQEVLIESSGEGGRIDRVDTYGNRFRFAPTQLNFNCASYNAEGQLTNYLKANELLTID